MNAPSLNYAIGGAGIPRELIPVEGAPITMEWQHPEVWTDDITRFFPCQDTSPDMDVRSLTIHAFAINF